MTTGRSRRGTFNLAAEEPTIQGQRSGWGVAFSPDAKTLAFGELQGIVKLWDVSAGRVCAVIRGPGQGVNGLAFSPDGTLLAAGAEDATTRLWDLTGSGRETVLRGHGRRVRTVEFSSDGTSLMTISSDVCNVWDLPTFRRRFRTTVPAEESEFEGAALARTARRWRSDGTRDREDLGRRRGERAAPFSPGWDYAHCTTFSPDGRELAVGLSSGSLKLWDVATGMPARPSGDTRHRSNR